MKRSAFILIFSFLAIGYSPLMTNMAYSNTGECAEGYVWREAFPGDHICVTKETHDLVAEENRNAEKNRAENFENKCEPGLVWRMAGPEDHVCVTQVERDQAQQDNSLARTRTPTAVVNRRHVDTLEIRKSIQKLPRQPGCFKYVNDEWQETKCVSLS